MPQDFEYVDLNNLLSDLREGFSLSKGAAVLQGTSENGTSLCDFYCFRHTSDCDFLQFFFPQRHGLEQLRNTKLNNDAPPDECDLLTVFHILAEHFADDWTGFAEHINWNLTHSAFVKAFNKEKKNLPKSYEELMEFQKGDPEAQSTFKRTDGDVEVLNELFSENMAVKSFLSECGMSNNQEIELNDRTKERLKEQGGDVIAATVALVMIWLVQLGACMGVPPTDSESFREKLYQQIRRLFLEDDESAGKWFRDIVQAAIDAPVVIDSLERNEPRRFDVIRHRDKEMDNSNEFGYQYGENVRVLKT